MSDTYVPNWAQDESVPLSNVVTAPSGRPRITVGPNPLPINNGSPGGSSEVVPNWAKDNSVPLAAPTTTGATNPAVDFAKSFPGGVVSGLGGVLSATGAAAQAEMSEPITAPTPQEADLALQQNVTGALPLPQGKGGQYGRTVGQFLATAPFSPPIPGVGPMAAGLGAVGAGLASEAAGQATAGTRFETPARLLAPVVAGLRTPRSAPATEVGALNAGRAAEVPTTQQLLTTGGAQINAAGAAAARPFQPPEMEQLVSDIEKTLKTNRSRDYRAPQVFRSIQELKDARSVDDIQDIRSLIGEIGSEQGGHEARAATFAQQEIDKYLKTEAPGAAQQLEEGRSNYGAGARAKGADTREDIATLRQKRAGYGGNARFVAATRQVLSPIVEKAIKFGQKGGHTDEEIAAMRDIIEGTTLTNTLRNFGMISPEKGILSTAVFGEVAEKLGFKIAGILTGASWLSNKLNTKLTMMQIERLNENLRKRSPMYEKAVKDAADRYTNTMNDFASNPTRQSLVKFLVASRNFSAGLRKDGIPLSSGDLLKGVEAPDDSDGTTNR